MRLNNQTRYMSHRLRASIRVYLGHQTIFDTRAWHFITCWTSASRKNHLEADGFADSLDADLTFLTRPRATLLRSLSRYMLVAKPFSHRVNWGGVFSLTVLKALADVYVSGSKARSDKQAEKIRTKPSSREYYALEGGV